MNILITGGASGLGEAITRLLAQNDKNKVFFTYHRSKIKADKIQDDFKNTYSIKCNFSDSGAVTELVDRIEGLELDVLINNAYSGDLTPTHFHKLLPNKFLNDFNENVIPTIQITQEVIKRFRKKKQGKIITILTSYLVNRPPMGLSSYLANKAYLEKLTKIWATENIRFNITSNSISPSFMLTGLTKDIDKRVIDQMISNHPNKKLVTVKEVSETVNFLVQSSSQINGVDILMNAGVNIK